MSFINKIGHLISGTAPSAATSSSRSVARERLSVILASQRGSDLLDGVDMEALQKDVMDVVQKHIRAAQARTASFNVKNEGDINLFEMSVELNGSKGGANNDDNITR
eukprot:scaffold816_cov43-Cyclotella_meneghiniana.AAC.4